MEQERIFDTDRLIPTYFKLALPVVFSMVITLIYNLADTYFIARTNDTMLVAGVSLCAPLFTVLMAIGNIYGQGGSSLISRLLGSGDCDSAARVSAFCFWFSLLTGVVIAVPMLLLRRPMLQLLGASAETFRHAFRPVYAGHLGKRYQSCVRAVLKCLLSRFSLKTIISDDQSTDWTMPLASHKNFNDTNGAPKNTAAKVVKTYHQPKSASKFLHLLPIKNDIFICSTCNWIEKL